MRAENMVNCPSCGAALVAGLRFCRRCGYRLGEGVEEYVPTQRFDAGSMPTVAPPSPATDPFQARQTWGAAPIQPFGSASAMGGQQAQGSTSKLAKMCRPVRGVWLWVTIIAVMLIVGGLLPLAMMSRRGGAAVPRVERAFLGVDGFETAPGGGALITGIAGPETPLLRAGLIGGDIIKRFAGKDVRNADDMRRILGEAPVGEPADVDYIRDNVPGSTKLTPGAEKDMPGMRRFDQRPGGRGVIGIDVGARVQVPNMNIYGVELDDVNRNEPADLAGLKEGDIVIKFGEYPIRTPGDLRYRIAEALPGSTVPVTVVRGVDLIEILVKIGRSRG